MSLTEQITVRNAEGQADTSAEILIANQLDYTPKVSVIIPVYNVEEYLKKCLDSVVNQSLKEIEIICIDDGSTDGSLDILKEYAEEDKRITVIVQPNTNAGVARNAGLAVARGEYIGFIDSDDYISSDMYSELYNKVKTKGFDICICEYAAFDTTSEEIVQTYGIKKDILKDFSQCKGDILHICSRDPIFQLTNPAPWNKIYNRDFLSQNAIKFQSIISSNDVAFTNTALSCAQTIALVPERLYYYRTNTKASLTDKKDSNPYLFYDAIKELHARLVRRGKFNAFQQSFVNVVAGYCIFNFDKVGQAQKRALKAICLDEIFPQYNISKETLSQLYFPYYQSRIAELLSAPKVSIILPIYNAEPYLCECLDSVIHQTLREIEIICVNDGSTDNSLNIIKEYADKDFRVRYIDKPNAGYGQTMNCGIAAATGEYIGIVEPDDFVKPEMYETLYNKAKEQDLDVIKADFYKFESVNGVYRYKKEKLINIDGYYNRVMNPDKFPELLLRMTINPAGIFKRGFLSQFNIRHNETPGAAYQDNGFWVQTMYQARCIMFLDSAFYCYRQDNPNQSMKKRNNLWTIPDEYDFIDTIFEKKPSILNLRKIYCYRKFLAYSFHLKSRISRNYWPEYLERMSQHFSIEKERGYIDPKYYSKNDLKELNLILERKFDNYISQYSSIKISIIVPVYNTAAYLEECLNSLINQTLDEIEIICIDDGSTDSSLEILKKFQCKDKRIIVITQKNQKQGAARNQGLKVATGEYVQFVDSDDYIAPSTCEELYKKCHALNLDMLSFGGTNFDNETRKLLANPYYEFKYLPAKWEKNVFDYHDCTAFLSKMAVSAALTIYKRTFLTLNNIIFPTQLYFEDNVFFVKAITQAKRVSIDNSLYYYRRIHSNSTTQNWAKNFNDYLKIIDLVLTYLKNNNIENNIYNIYKTSYLNIAKSFYNRFSNQEQKKFHKALTNTIDRYSDDKQNPTRVLKAYLLFPYYLWKRQGLRKPALRQPTDKNVIHKILQFFYHVQKTPKHKKTYIMGIRVWKRNANIYTYIDWRLNNIAKGLNHTLSSQISRLEKNIISIKKNDTNLLQDSLQQHYKNLSTAQEGCVASFKNGLEQHNKGLLTAQNENVIMLQNSFQHYYTDISNAQREAVALLQNKIDDHHSHLKASQEKGIIFLHDKIREFQRAFGIQLSLFAAAINKDTHHTAATVAESHSGHHEQISSIENKNMTTTDNEFVPIIPKIIGIQGTYYSGSSTLIGMFQEFANMRVIGFSEPAWTKNSTKSTQTECYFFSSSGFIEMIQAFKKGTPEIVDMRIRRFLSSVNDAYNHKRTAPGENIPGLYEDTFREITQDLLLKILELDDHTRDFMKTRIFPFTIYENGDSCFDSCNFICGEGKGRYVSYRFADISEEEFHSHISDYLEKFFSILSGKEYTVYDQFLPRKTLEIVNSYLRNPIKQIIVIRDPRDQYISADKKNLTWFPRTPQGLKNYIVGKLAEYSLDDPNRLIVRFEDIVLNYDQTRKRILDFIGCSPDEHVAPKTIFDPAISVANIGAYRRYHRQEFMQEIEKELGKYCFYPEKENLSTEAIELLKSSGNWDDKIEEWKH